MWQANTQTHAHSQVNNIFTVLKEKSIRATFLCENTWAEGGDAVMSVSVLQVTQTSSEQVSHFADDKRLCCILETDYCTFMHKLGCGDVPRLLRMWPLNAQQCLHVTPPHSERVCETRAVGWYSDVPFSDSLIWIIWRVTWGQKKIRHHFVWHDILILWLSHNPFCDRRLKLNPDVFYWCFTQLEYVPLKLFSSCSVKLFF